jgi:hypothetical protein
MTIRIDTTALGHGAATIEVAGELAGEAVAVLEGELDRIGAEAHCVVVDLRNVESIDEGGLDLLRHWALPVPGDDVLPDVRLTLGEGSRVVRVQLASRGLTAE